MAWKSHLPDEFEKVGFFEQLKIAKKLNIKIFLFWSSFNSAWAKDSEEKEFAFCAVRFINMSETLSVCHIS